MRNSSQPETCFNLTENNKIALAVKSYITIYLEITII